MRVSSLQAVADSSLADWLQGWGTVSGSIFSAIAALAATALLRHEMLARRAELAESEIRQARAVILAVEDWVKEEEGVANKYVRAEVVVRNFSESMIFNVDIAYKRSDGIRHSGGTSLTLDYLPPGHERRIVVNFDPPGDPAKQAKLLATGMTFVDAAGRSWARYGKAQPVRLLRIDRTDLDKWRRA
jgi:hypothetical protein